MLNHLLISPLVSSTTIRVPKAEGANSPKSQFSPRNNAALQGIGHPFSRSSHEGSVVAPSHPCLGGQVQHSPLEDGQSPAVLFTTALPYPAGMDQPWDAEWKNATSSFPVSQPSEQSHSLSQTWNQKVGVYRMILICLPRFNLFCCFNPID